MKQFLLFSENLKSSTGAYKQKDRKMQLFLFFCHFLHPATFSIFSYCRFPEAPKDGKTLPKEELTWRDFPTNEGRIVKKANKLK